MVEMCRTALGDAVQGLEGCWFQVGGTCVSWDGAFALFPSAGDDAGVCGDSDVAEGPGYGAAHHAAPPAPISSAPSVWLDCQA